MSVRLAGLIGLLASAGVIGCSADIPEGRFACSADGDCPPRWHCHADMRCYSEAEVGDAGERADGALEDGAVEDAGRDGGREAMDSGMDAGREVNDAGEDAGDEDAGGEDAGGVDAGGVDAGGVDAGGVDAGGVDAGGVDAGGMDAGGMDAGRADSGLPDAGRTDAGIPDAGMSDAGMSDAGIPDAGMPDAGPPPDCTTHAMCDDGNACTSDTCNMTAGVCQFTPRTGTSCGSGRICCAGACCSAGFGCCGSACRSLVADPNCGTCGNDCRVGGEHCVGGLCEECGVDSHCPGSEVCVGNVCVECRGTGTCTSPMGVSGFCVDNVCEECGVDSHCAPGVCIDNVCEECRGTGPCSLAGGSTGWCVDNECVECRGPSDCTGSPAGPRCIGGFCGCTGVGDCPGVGAAECIEATCVGNVCGTRDIASGTPCDEDDNICSLGSCSGTGRCVEDDPAPDPTFCPVPGPGMIPSPSCAQWACTRELTCEFRRSGSCPIDVTPGNNCAGGGCAPCGNTGQACCLNYGDLMRPECNPGSDPPLVCTAGTCLLGS